MTGRIPGTVAFDDPDSARAAVALGPVVFRCRVCGGTHSTDRPGEWECCLDELAMQLALERWPCELPDGTCGNGVMPRLMATVWLRVGNAREGASLLLGDRAIVAPEVVAVMVPEETLRRCLRAGAEEWLEKACEWCAKELGLQDAGQLMSAVRGCGPGRIPGAVVRRRRGAKFRPEKMASVEVRIHQPGGIKCGRLIFPRWLAAEVGLECQRVNAGGVPREEPRTRCLPGGRSGGGSVLPEGRGCCDCCQKKGGKGHENCCCRVTRHRQDHFGADACGCAGPAPHNGEGQGSRPADEA